MSEYRNTRPDSPKGKVWTMFDTKGESAARKLGEKLGLAGHKVERWLKDDGKGFLPAAKGEAKPKKNGKAVEAKAKKNGKAPVEAKAPSKPKKTVKKAA